MLPTVHEGGFHWAKGPESGSTGRKAKVVANDETSSSRARDQVNPVLVPAIIKAPSKTLTSGAVQCDFREELVCRDGRCILTGTARSECDAAHLVPTTREDVRSFSPFQLCFSAKLPYRSRCTSSCLAMTLVASSTKLPRAFFSQKHSISTTTAIAGLSNVL